jgi:hypothetical protein
MSSVGTTVLWTSGRVCVVVGLVMCAVSDVVPLIRCTCAWVLGTQLPPNRKLLSAQLFAAHTRQLSALNIYGDEWPTFGLHRHSKHAGARAHGHMSRETTSFWIPAHWDSCPAFNKSNPHRRLNPQLIQRLGHGSWLPPSQLKTKSVMLSTQLLQLMDDTSKARRGERLCTNRLSTLHSRIGSSSLHIHANEHAMAHRRSTYTGS